jgi:Putative transposase
MPPFTNFAKLHKVLYRSKDGKNEKTFDAIEWLAAMSSHVPNKGEQMIRYYGYYSPAVWAGSGSRVEGKPGYRLFRLVRPGGPPSGTGFYVDPQYPSDLCV